jgi:hypothetical protein
MEVSKPNEYGAMNAGQREVVASHGRAFAAVKIALCEDGLYRFSVELNYSYGGFCGPVWIETEGYSSIAEARTAGLEDLLRRWHTPFPSEPTSVHTELRVMRDQIESQLCQRSLF